MEVWHRLCTVLLTASGCKPVQNLTHFRTLAALPLILGVEHKDDADYLMRLGYGGTPRASKVNCQRMTTLARKLGTTEHHSLLLRKAKEAGLYHITDLIGLAIARGCQHYRGGSEPVPTAPPSRETFSDEELAVALLSPCLPYSPRALRVGAQMLGSRGNRPSRLALLARRERAETVVRHIAAAGRQTEPQELFWQELLAALPPASSLRSSLPTGVLPHPSRFRSETGLTNPLNSATGGGPQVMWLRPSTAVSA